MVGHVIYYIDHAPRRRGVPQKSVRFSQAGGTKLASNYILKKKVGVGSAVCRAAS